MEEKVKIYIDGLEYFATKDSSILDAAKQNGYNIPTLCHYKSLNISGSCRVCLVEVVGIKGLVAACDYPIKENMQIYINTLKAKNARKMSVEMILSNHSKQCLICEKNKHCELQEVSNVVGITNLGSTNEAKGKKLRDPSEIMYIKSNRCILCGRCIEVCKKYQGIGILDFQKRGSKTSIGTLNKLPFADVPCINCGQCVNVCPTGAIGVKDDIDKVSELLDDQEKVVLVQVAPAVRAAIGEEFDYPIGTNVTGKMVAAIKRLGFNKVFDTSIGADLTILEEANELIDRITKHSGALPMLTSCSPGWVKYLEFNHPELINNLSTCKSPHMMLGAILKSYYAQHLNLNKKNLIVVSIMPCVAKKFEISRPEMVGDVDYVLTTRELASMIKTNGIDFASLKDEPFDEGLLGEHSGAGVIFGVTGGLSEAAIRTAYKLLEGVELDSKHIEFSKLRGFDNIKQAEIKLPKTKTSLKIAITSSMVNAEVLLKQIKEGKSPFHFIEIMGCPNGCINGGGQPFLPIKIANSPDMGNYLAKRASVLYGEDRKSIIRKSHLNNQIEQLYASFLIEPNSEKAHSLLHTHYSEKEKFNF
jgi:iron-only hydrogenase group A